MWIPSYVLYSYIDMCRQEVVTSPAIFNDLSAFFRVHAPFHSHYPPSQARYADSKISTNICYPSLVSNKIRHIIQLYVSFESKTTTTAKTSETISPQLQQTIYLTPNRKSSFRIPNNYICERNSCKINNKAQLPSKKESFQRWLQYYGVTNLTLQFNATLPPKYKCQCNVQTGTLGMSSLFHCP